ncbi:MAG: SCO family protein [Paracoccus sp. (in: a-proteobacteria)]|uniref:SCO family protein n=1 Tax=Paracoccus sp. TaxID=267 RepID=UPI003241DD75
MTNIFPTSAQRLRLVLWSVAVLAAIGTGLALWSAQRVPAASAPGFQGEADIRSAFTLTDHTGQVVTQADYAGRWQLVFFGFTHCPDICPTTLAYMANVLDLLGSKADNVAPLFVTVDPARDTVPVMAAYVSAFHPRMIGLTGTEAQVAEATGNYRTWFEPGEDATAPDGYVMAHAGHLYLMRPDGTFEAVFMEGEQPPEALAEEIAMRIEKEERMR